MIFTSSFVMGGPAVDEPEELDAMEMALEEEPDELDEDSPPVFGLKGGGCPTDRNGDVVSTSEVGFSRAGES